MSDSQVVDADHSDRVQYNDLAKEHDFFLYALGAAASKTSSTLRVDVVVTH